jgi:hypothetical protein
MAVGCGVASYLVIFADITGEERISHRASIVPTPVSEPLASAAFLYGTGS